MIRQLKVARDTARKAKTAAIVTLKTLVVNVPAPLRQSLQGLGDNSDRIHSEAAFAKLCGTCPIPASSGQTNRHRQANAALYRIVIVRMRFHQSTIDYVARRSTEGLTKKDIIRCLKRFVAHEAYQRVMTDHRARQPAAHATT